MGWRQYLYQKPGFTKMIYHVLTTFKDIVQRIAYQQPRNFEKCVHSSMCCDSTNASMTLFDNLVETYRSSVFFLFLHAIEFMKTDVRWHKKKLYTCKG